MKKVILKRGREDSVLRFHPWIFSGAVADVHGSPDEGDLVAVCSCDGSVLAFGHWQIGSIAVRILSFGPDMPGPDFWEEMLSKALAVRKAVLPAFSGTETDCYRLVHGEGDSLPGLIVDYYRGVCVIQAHSAGMFRAKRQIAEALRRI